MNNVITFTVHWVSDVGCPTIGFTGKFCYKDRARLAARSFALGIHVWTSVLVDTLGLLELECHQGFLVFKRQW